MAEIEELTKPLTKPLAKLKGKKLWIVGGVGVAILALAVKAFGGGSAAEPEADVIGGDQSIDALGSQLQTLGQSMGEFQTSVSANQASITDQIIELQNAQEIALTSPSVIYTQPVEVPKAPIVVPVKQTTSSASAASSISNYQVAADWANSIAPSNYSDRPNTKTNYEMSDNSKQSVAKGDIDYDVVRANAKSGESTAQTSTRLYGYNDRDVEAARRGGETTAQAKTRLGIN